ncbi:calcium-binding protein [Rivibacter subsaxonicus]|uniref:Ca2+-binding RTX toxin-like protein n=1 Tax=Rivibacter subsaxonicus TaxID=457575 RepID=A0A4Q7W006_9BURK|nr:calcium-binding protein [Rivibacter subsaxonicus]RZU02313.1 Ca2+-binding RTX toxin-like protein [Rivibacter subsaxonicus]
MSTIQDAYWNALLADATYALLANVENKSGDALRDLLKERMTEPLANHIATNFSLVTHIETDDVTGSGFDATVWRRSDGKIYVSMQGTTGLQDFLTDAQLAITGNGRDQIAAMANWWFKITTPVGQTARQISVEQVEVGRDPFGLPIMQAQLKEVPGVAGAGKVSAADLAGGIEVNGHSLGGYLASAFTRLFGAQAHVTHTSTFNSAGFAPGSEAVFAQWQSAIGPGYGLGRYPNASEQTNYFAEKGLNVTTNTFWFSQVGKRVSIFNEGGAGVPNHFIYKLTDSLALTVAMEKLDPSITIERASTMFAAGSNQMAGSLEGVLDGLRRLLLGPASANTPAGDAGDNPNSRVSFHTNLGDLGKSALVTALQGKVRFETSGAALGSKARTDFGALAALLTLSPVWVAGNGTDDAALNAVWASAAWSTQQGQWLADKGLSASQREAGQATFSDEWIADRAAMLGALMRYNTTDASGGVVRSQAQGAYQIIYSDATTSTTLAVQNSGSQPRAYVKLGGGGSESLLGEGLADHLYGGAGNDVLNGQGGNDYLEGNADNDTLDGGTGNDKLLGGRGTDTYVFTGNWGADEIVDADGTGTLQIEGLTGGLPQGKKWVDNVFRSADQLVLYKLVDQGSGRRDVVISFEGRADTITLRSWVNGQFGITLDAVTTVPATSNTASGSFIKKLDTNGTTFVLDAFGNYVSDGVLTTEPDSLIGTAAADRMIADVGNDALMGGAGDDLLEGGDGSDLLLGGAGADNLQGGAGNDFIFGSGEGAVSLAERRAGTQPVADGPELGRGFGWVVYDQPGVDANGNKVWITAGPSASSVSSDAGNVIDGGAGDDRIVAGLGDDLVQGGADNDLITGMAGDDMLDGGAGNDSIEGDATDLQGYISSTPGVQHGNDIIDGGAGDDRLTGDGGDDLLYGGADNDSLWGDASNVRDAPAQFHGRDYLDGGEGNDYLAGGGSDDELDGGNGNDNLWGDDSEQALPLTAHGDDTLDGDAGNDTLAGAGGSDLLLGGSGDDALFGDASEDFVPLAGHGDDYLDGQDGNDTLYGGGGDDVVVGGTGNDQLEGGVGDDVIDGGAGTDVLKGGDGNDTYVLRLGEMPISGQGYSEVIDDTSGTDRVVLEGVPESGIATVSAFADALIIQSTSAEQVFIRQGAAGSVESYELGDGQRLSTSEMVGRFSQDVIETTLSNGARMALGGRRNDVLSVSGGRAVLSGGWGDDTLTALGGGNSYKFSRGDGADTISDGAMSGGSLGLDGASCIFFGETIAAADIQLSFQGTRLVLQTEPASSDAISIEGFNRSDALTQLAIDEFAFDGVGSLTLAQLLARGFDLVGTVGNDVLFGSSISDRFDGGTGDDSFDGGTGADTYRWGIGYGRDTVTDADANFATADTLQIDGALAPSDLVLQRSGNDLIVRSRTTTDQITVIDQYAGTGVEGISFGGGLVWTRVDIDANLSNDLSEGPDVFTGTVGADVISGLDGNDTISGLAGSDVIDGGNGHDSLSGGDGDDTLFGSAGTDMLAGAAGSDVLDGGAGDDNLSGGTGDNVYRFGRGDGQDLITWMSNSSGAMNTLEFKDEITPADLTLVQYGFAGDLVVRIAGTTDQVTVGGFFQGPDAGATPSTVQGFHFLDGTVWDARAILSRAFQGTTAADSIKGTTADDTISGGAGADLLNGDAGDDLLDGGAGVDTLQGDSGNDTLIGGEYMTGAAGNDTYVITAWPNAALTVHDSSGALDVLVLPAEATPTTVEIDLAYSNSSRTYDALSITLPWCPAIQVEGFYGSATADSVEEVRFADGTVWTRWDLSARLRSGRLSDADDQAVLGFRWSDLLDGKGGNDLISGMLGDDSLLGGAGQDTLYGSEGHDTVSGNSGDDELYGDSYWWTDTGDGNDSIAGGDGNDTLYGTGGHDTLEGAAGTDVLFGGEGDDAFLFGAGSGDDKLYEQSGADRVVLAADVLPSDVSVVRHGDDLVLAVNGSATQLWLMGQAGPNWNSCVERVEFADQTVWLQSDLLSLASGTGTANSTTGTADNDNYAVDHPSDVIVESAGQGVDFVMSSVNFTLPNEVENLTLTGLLNTHGVGNQLANQLTGNAGNNTLVSGAGSGTDTLAGGDGDDVYDLQKFYSWTAGPTTNADVVVELGGGGTDTVLSDAYHYTLETNVEHLVSTAVDSWNLGGKPLAALIHGNVGDNAIDASIRLSTTRIDGGAGNDTMHGGTGNDTYVVDSVGDVVFEAAQNTSVDTIESSVDWALVAGIENLTLVGTVATGGIGTSAANVLDGSAYTNAAGTQTWAVNQLTGLAGDDIYLIDASDSVTEAINGGFDKVIVAAGSVGTYALATYTNVEALQLGQAVNHSNIQGTDAAEQLYGNTYSNIIVGGAGDDALVDAVWPAGTLSYGPGDWDRLEGGDGNDSLLSTSGTDVLDGGIGNDVLTIKNSTSSTVEFGSGHDVVHYQSASGISVRINGALSVDSLQVQREGEALRLSFAGGLHSLNLENFYQSVASPLQAGGYSECTFADGTVLSADNLAVLCVNGIGSPGTDQRDVLIGTPEGDTLAALADADLVLGRDGDDVIAGGTGDDTILGGIGADAVQGNDGDDYVRGEDGSDSLDGALGNDSLYGGDGIDLLFGGDGDDSLSGDAGSDALQGDAGLDLLDGGEGDDLLTGGDGIDTLRGGAGFDTLVGADGSDVIDPGSGFDVIRLGRGSGADRVTGYDAGGDEILFDEGVAPTDLLLSYSGSDLLITIAGTADSLRVEQFVNYWNQVSLRFADGTTWTSYKIWEVLTTVHGTEAADVLTGANGSDRLYARGGNDTLDGRDGHDLLDGGVGDDTLTGGTGYDTLDGGPGIDRMVGGGDSDFYLVDNAADLIVEVSGGGDYDWVEASVAYTLPSFVEGLELTGIGNISGTGNSLDNSIEGNAGNNTLTGGAGADELYDYDGGADSLNGGTGADDMEGGPGDDTYVVDSAQDAVYEYELEGNDLVQASVSYVLPDEVERLTLTGGSALSGEGNLAANAITGNTAANVLRGHAGDDTLSGGTGADSMYGGLGNDSYVVDNAADLVSELAGEGTDSVSSSATYTLAADVENLTLTGSSALKGTGNALDNLLSGNTGANSITGGAGNDTINGGSGNDTMLGGTGDDTYFANVATDVVTEAVNEGIDTVNSSATLTLSANVENLTLTGTSALNGTGNTLANVLIGNSGSNLLTGGDGNDTIDGGMGNDTMVGGIGNDTFYVDVSTDVITEAAGAGTDTVMSGVTLSLGSNLENLTLTGSNFVNGTGNTLNNTLTGNSVANTLSGGEGNDTYIGAAGNDTVTDSSTTSADVYRWGIGAGNDSISDAGGADRIEIAAGAVSSQVTLTRSGNNLQVGITGATDVLTVLNWYTATANKIEEIKLADGTIIGAGAAPMSVVTGIAASTSLLVDAMAQFDAPAAGDMPLERRAWFEQPMLAVGSL